MLGSIRQLDGLNEFPDGERIPHPSCLSEGSRESSKKFVDDDTLGDLASGGTPGEQPMTRQPCEFGGLGTGGQPRLVFPVLEQLGGTAGGGDNKNKLN